MSDTNSGAIQRAELKRAARRASKNLKGIGNTKTYSQLPHYIFQSEQYAKLRSGAVKGLIDLLAQYRGTNNGDLTTAWRVMKKRGWRSKDLLRKAIQELEARGWIVKTRQGIRYGGVNAPNLWALTFFGIDDCRDRKGNRKADLGAPRPDSMPLHLWKQPEYDKPLETSRRGFKTKRLPESRAIDSPSAGPFPKDEGGKVVNLTPLHARVSGQ